jgi:hypothetical protein
MSDINQMMLKEISSAVDEGRENCADLMLEVEELESEILHKRVALEITKTVLAALIAKRTELLADQAPPPVAGNACEARSPKVPEGRTVENPAVDIQRDASERILNMFDQPDSATCYSVAKLTEEVYGVFNPHNLKKCRMRLYDLQRRGKVVFNRPICASTVVERAWSGGKAPCV